MKISTQLIKQLRDETGAGVLDTKLALEDCGGDYEKAVQLLREKGLAKAAKRADRQATEGRVEARSVGKKTGLLVEVNCETDFVGQNESFVALANRMADHFLAQAREGQPVESLMALPLAGHGDQTPAGALRKLIATTGENMAVRRCERYDLGDRPGIIEVYLHPGNRVAVMLELNGQTAAAVDADRFSTLAHDLALHIAAMAPLCVTRGDIPADRLQAERESYRQQALAEGKPEHLVDRIVEGRLNKFYQDRVLFEQPFVKNEEVTVGELVQQIAAELGEEISLARFTRYELGEETA